MDFKSLLVKFEGRINGASYWHAVLETLISCLLFLLIFKAGLKLVEVVFQAIFGNPLPFDASFSDALLIFAVWNVEHVAAVTIKRLHDRNKSGWWIVPFVIATVLLHRPPDWLDNPILAVLVDALAFGLGAWCLIELCLAGTRGPNRFGPDPLTPRKTAWVERGPMAPMPPIVGPPPTWLVRRDHEPASADPCCRQ